MDDIYTQDSRLPGVSREEQDKEHKLKEDLYRQILSSISHDLKTPLATIIGSLEVHNLLEHKLSEEKRKSLISSALSEAHRLDRFISNILDMARLESGAVAVSIAPTRLATVISDSISRLGPLKDKGTIRVHPQVEPVEVVTDSVLLGRVVMLLLENALKHTGIAPSIDIDYGVNDTEGHIHIRDRGPGIPPDKMRAIFSKYTRLSKRDQQVAGTGLGLAIARQILDLLNGRVEVANHPETGAVFSIYLPVKA